MPETLHAQDRQCARAYKALHTKGAMTSGQPAAAVGAKERYLREWLSHQVASNHWAKAAHERSWLGRERAEIPAFL